ncbi:MAG TPA: histidine phosphatase family protein [Solirubrobacteraceae bacterium]|nr:histidine phosphatase family protein [Solirubrobacteraceae bacterium]
MPLLLARHGQTADNAHGLILGRRDPPLSELGEEQAAGLATKARARGIVAIWCSPLLRARQTAAMVGHVLSIQPAVLDDLIESARGEWEGVPQTVLTVREPDRFAAFEAGDPDFVFPGGESIRSQVLRTRRALTQVATGPQPSLIIAHAGTIRAALIATGQPVGPERALIHGETVAVAWHHDDRPN